MTPWRAAGPALGVTVALVLCAPACGSDEQPGPPASGTGARSTGGSSGGPDLGSIGGDDGATGGAGELDDQCAGELIEAQYLPLDMYVMLDVSGSMIAATEGDPTISKWRAVSTALGDFVNDAASDGMGMGLQVFPIKHPDAPASCTADDQCGEFGPCLNSACWPLIDGELVLCVNALNCALGQQCVVYGECQNDTEYVCNRETVTQCGMGLGACEVPPSPCLATDDCRPAVYATPAAEIAELPAARATLLGTLQATEPNPEGATPTGPALQGAIEQAASWAAAHGDRQVVAVLATDGLPTSCSPVDIGDVAAIAAAGRLATPSVSTFVIGVFGSEDEGAAENLDGIALAGGTESAFIVDTQGDVTAQFRDALNQIRASRLACDLLVPEAAPGMPVDYDLVNVVFDAGGGPITLGYAAEGSGCDTDPSKGGWYFDKDPDAQEAPEHILICPSACEQFRQAAAGSVQIKLGCQRRDVVK